MSIQEGPNSLFVGREETPIRYIEKLEDFLATKEWAQNSLKFNIKGLGYIHIDGKTKKVTDKDKPADCTLSMDRDTFNDLLSGKLDTTTAFMQDKLQVSGDMSVAMKMGPIIAAMRG